MANRRRRRRQAARGIKADLSERISTATLLFLGLILGLAGGLSYAWVIAPVVHVDASPARFSERYKEEYIYLVSQSYATDGNWVRTEQRLAALDDETIAETIAEMVENYLRQQKPASEVSNLAVLARELGAESPAVALFAPTPLPGAATATPSATPLPLPTATVTETPPPTATPPPTLTATPIPEASPTTRHIYRLLAQERVCRPGEANPIIEVITQDALLNPLAGVEVLVSWEGGSDHFYTGFKPAQGPGYGDFTMSPDRSYTVVLADGSPAVSGLRIEACRGGLDGGWRLVFQNLILRPTETPQP